MKDPLKTIGNLIDKQNVAFISSVSESGYPNTKAMLPPRKREGIKTFYFTTNTSSMRTKQTSTKQTPKLAYTFVTNDFLEALCLSEL